MNVVDRVHIYRAAAALHRVAAVSPRLYEENAKGFTFVAAKIVQRATSRDDDLERQHVLSAMSHVNALTRCAIMSPRNAELHRLAVDSLEAAANAAYVNAIDHDASPVEPRE